MHFLLRGRRGVPKITREHLVSRPLASAFGIDRSAPLLRSDGDLGDARWTTVNGVARKGVCGDCNSGWMNQLEHSMGSIAAWLTGSAAEPLGGDRELILRSWAIKTHVLLCFIDGDAARFGDGRSSGAVLAPFSLVRALYEREWVTIRRAGGVALSAASTHFAWAFGHPRLVRTGPSHWTAKFAPASVVTIGALQIWTAPAVAPGTVTA